VKNHSLLSIYGRGLLDKLI